MSETRVTVTDELVNRVLVSEDQPNIVQVLTSGAQGPAGTEILKGDVPPTSSDGRRGDYFLDAVSRHLYGPKTVDGWDLDNYVDLEDIPLGELSDVTLTSTADQDILMYRADTNTWGNQRLRYRYEQTDEADEWVIDHDLASQPPAVSVFDTANIQVFGDIDHVSANRVVLRFSEPLAGVAYLV